MGYVYLGTYEVGFDSQQGLTLVSLTRIRLLDLYRVTVIKMYKNSPIQPSNGKNLSNVIESHLCVTVFLPVTEYRNNIVRFTNIVKCGLNMPGTFILFSALNLVYIIWLYQTSDCQNYLLRLRITAAFVEQICLLHLT